MINGGPIHTYQTRPHLDEVTEAAFDEMANLFSRVERTLFTDIMSGKTAAELKSEYINRYRITARQFNACRVKVEGLITSRRELLRQQIFDVKQKMDALEKEIQRLEGKVRHLPRLFFKKKRLRKLREKLQAFESDQENGTVRVCFGTKKLFHAQFHLEKSGFQSFEEWKQEWKQARSNAFFFLGSKDETSGNQTCAATLQQNGTITLRIRVPDALVSQFGKYLIIPNVFFNYGQNEITTSLNDCKYRKELQSLKNPEYRYHGQAISYRFVKDKKGWRIFASTTLSEPERMTSTKQGVLGVDINADHLAVVETDRTGNPIRKHSIPLNLYGKNHHQSLAEIGDACKEIIQLAIQTNKDLVIEDLNFQQKKVELKQLGNSKYRRMLSSLAYDAIIRTLKSRAFRFGVHLHRVNPAFTSLIGRIKFAKRYGISIHQAAALSIGRRLLGFSERPPRHLNNIPDGKGGYVTLSVPVRNRLKHAWSHLKAINRELQAVLAAHFRAALNRSSDPPSRFERQPLSVVVGETPTRESLVTLLD
jgi:IS605 OrfB family transposase